MAGNLTAMIASIFSGSAVTPDPYYEYTTLLLPGNGTNGAQNNTFLDGSTNNFTITRNGNTTQGTFSPFSQTGWGNYFDGTGDYLATPTAQTPLTLNTDDFTLECWYYLPAQVQANTVLISSSNSSSIANALLIQLDTLTNAWGFYINGTNLLASASGKSATLNTWQHIAVTRSGSTFNFYLNGVAATGVSTSSASISVANWLIGYWYLAVHALTGYISNLRIVKGVVVYTGNFTPPTSPLAATQSAGTNISAITGTQTSLLTCQSNRFIDNSTNNFTITRNGDTRVVAFSPFNPTSSWSATTNGGSGYFDGTGDTLALPSSANLAVGTGDFCVEAWVYWTATGVLDAIYSNGLNSAGGDTQLSIQLTAGNKVQVAGWSTVFLTGATSVVSNTWNHIVVCRSGTTLSAFLNGSRDATTTSANNWSSTNAFYIADYPVGGATFSGYISNLRVVKGSTPYDATSSTLTVPTAPLTAISGTSLLLNFTNGGIYDATSKNDLETVGNAQISTTQSKWGGSSMSFDGTGDWLLNQAPIPPTTFGSADFSIEMWIYATTSGTQRWLFDGRIATPADGAYPAIYISSGNVLVYYVSAAARITGTTTISTGTWYFVQVIRTSGTTKMYLNGTQEGSNYTDSTVYLNPSVARPIIGAATNLVQPFTGYIQDLRVTNGYARPTTTPTAAFPTL
jgi:hypothetical protein